MVDAHVSGACVERHAGSSREFESRFPLEFSFGYWKELSLRTVFFDLGGLSDRSGGGIGRHAGLKILWAAMSVRVRFPSRARILQDA